jgi:predicted MFS family arabinose efflux permease
VFASHQFGAAAAALTAGIIRDTFGSYTYAWFGGAALCLIAAILSSALRKRPDPRQTSPATNDRREMEIEAETASDLTP